MPAKNLMNCIYDGLADLNTEIKPKSNDYHIKCFVKTKRKASYYYKPELEEININKFEQENILKKAKEKSHDDTKKKENKYSKSELTFHIQIYSLSQYSGLKNEYLLDIRLSRGHPLVFLDYCKKFLSVLHNKTNLHK